MRLYLEMGKKETHLSPWGVHFQFERSFFPVAEMILKKKKNLSKTVPVTMGEEENLAKKPEPVTFSSDLNLTQRCLQLEKRWPEFTAQ